MVYIEYMESKVAQAPWDWHLSDKHTITTWLDTHSETPYAAECTCGWHAASVDGGLRNWNVDGHAGDVRAGRV
jgi:hypothetical protein